MAISYRSYEPQQDMLLPASLQDWLPKGHLAYFIGDTVDALDLSAFYFRYAGGGARNQPFHPAMMVKLLVYGYATGVFSSRKIERRMHEDLAFRMLGAGNFPKHRTIRDFRALHLLELSDLFVQVVRLAREMGLVKLGTVAIDGTKIKANASRHKAMSYERMQQAEGELKAQIGVPEPKAQDNFTDPDSRIMKRTGGGFDASDNAQTASADTAHIIVAAELSNNAADVRQLVPMLQAVKANTGESPRHGLADAG